MSLYGALVKNSKTSGCVEKPVKPRLMPHGLNLELTRKGTILRQGKEKSGSAEIDLWGLSVGVDLARQDNLTLLYILCVLAIGIFINASTYLTQTCPGFGIHP